MLFGSAFALLALVICAAATIGFPVCGWLRSEKRRGEAITLPALLGVILLGLIGVASLALLVSARGLIRGD
jgi:hypothetical protein